MQNPESVLENETHKLLYCLEIQMDPLMSAKRPRLIIVNKKKVKKTYRIVDFVVAADPRIKLKENKKKG